MSMTATITAVTATAMTMMIIGFGERVFLKIVAIKVCCDVGVFFSRTKNIAFKTMIVEFTSP